MNMIEVKTADLLGAALDWAVGIAEGRSLQNPVSDAVWDQYCEVYSPSTDWSQGGPLIESHRLEILFSDYKGEQWYCVKEWVCETPDAWYPMSKTPLIAACRAIVAAKLGDTVSIPAELLTSS